MKKTTTEIAQLEEQITGVRQSLSRLIGNDAVGSSQESCADFADVEIKDCPLQITLTERENKLKAKRDQVDLSIDSYK